MSLGQNCGGPELSRWEQAFLRLRSPFDEFIHHEATSGLLLMGCAALAMFLANSGFAPWYEAILHSRLTLSLGDFRLSYTVHHWINDGLMSLFFFVVGLEIKREILVGELADRRQAILPVVAAIGGMALPALFYVVGNGQETLKGWAIPMATDIAFAVGVLVLVGKRLPKALMGFLLALAIVDDLGAVLIIAFFYTANIIWLALAGAVGAFILLLLCNLVGLRSPLPYFLLGGLLWLFLLASGVHATLAGVLTALTVPANSRCAPGAFYERMTELLRGFARAQHSTLPRMATGEQQVSLHAMEQAVQLMETPLQRLEHILHSWVSFLIVPLFALANAGIAIDVAGFGEILRHPVTIGVVVGLVAGKAIGIFGAIFVSVKFWAIPLPRDVRLQHLFGLSLLAGIGFTMSIFIGELAFSDQAELLRNAKIGVVLGSVLAGVSGALWLKIVQRS